jgi:hypothetical protein
MMNGVHQLFIESVFKIYQKNISLTKYIINKMEFIKFYYNINFIIKFIIVLYELLNKVQINLDNFLELLDKLLSTYLFLVSF